MFEDVQTFEEEFGRKIKLPTQVVKIRTALGIAYDYRFNKEFDKYNEQIKRLHNKHEGERCFIIGSGPSLNKTDFSLIKNEILFGVNTLYRGLKKFDISCDYWAVVDGKLFEVHYKPLLKLDTTLFLAEHAGQRYLKKKEFYSSDAALEPIVLRHLGSMNIWNKFSRDITQGVFSGGTVVIQSIQIAFYLGFKQVYLLGCDSDYSGMHRFDNLMTENVDGKGVTGGISYLFSAYEICRNAFEDEGREIINSTVGGKLEVFKRKRLEDVVGS